jgi:hypothetical protein
MQEPHMEVVTPGSKNLQNYLANRLLVYIYREFRATEKPGCLPHVRADDLTVQFPNYSESFLRKRLKHCADLQVWIVYMGIDFGRMLIDMPQFCTVNVEDLFK